MMYKVVLTPNKKNYTIEMPERFFGKKVEVIVVEIENGLTSGIVPTPPLGRNTSVDELFESFGTAPDFPSVEEIRTKAWPSKWLFLILSFN